MELKTKSLIQFKGVLTFERIGILLNELKKKKETTDIHPVVYKKLLTLMIEVLENILKYSEHFEDFTSEKPEFLPEVELNFGENEYILIARNPIRQDAMRIIKERIERLNNSDEKALKEFYRETITNGIFTEKGGAGLGFIEMAKIVTQPMGCRFLPVGKGYSIFELKLNLNHLDSYQ